MNRFTCFAALAVLGLLVNLAQAADPAISCETGKLKASGKYSSCTLAAVAKSVSKSEPIDVSKCDATLGKSWTSAEGKGDGMCPGGAADQAGIQAFLDACNDSVADALGGAALPLNVVACNSNLAACNSSLGNCSSNLGSCSSALTACQAGAHWTCDPLYYGTNDGCDCGCGIIDPDCAGPEVANCEFCSNDGSCGLGCETIDPGNNSVCGAWLCDPAFFGADDGCDCGCGLIDPDCADANVASCDYCDEGCSVLGCPGDIDPSRNWTCAP